MSEYKEGQVWNFTPAENANTGPVTINGAVVVDVPSWLQAMVVIGDEIGMRNDDGKIEWTLNGVPVSDPSASPPLPSG